MRRTDIVQLASGQEKRIARWSQSRRRFEAGYGLKSASDLEKVIAFFEAREGRRYAFRWRDPFDCNSSSPGEVIQPTDQQIGVGDGSQTEFQLVKIYQSGSISVERTIPLPVPETVAIALDGTELNPTDFSLKEGGLIEFVVPPGAGVNVTAGFEFDIPVRFDTDELQLSLAPGGGTVPNIPIVEVLA